VLVEEVQFRPDLYAGTADYYERYRPAYPAALLDRLVEEAGVTGRGRLLDVACGTGQVAFGLSAHFEEVWAVDQEPDMLSVGRLKAERLGVGHIQWFNSPAEELDAPPESFELVTAGNAFHRLQRPRLASQAYEWLGPGGCFALLWGGSPWEERTEWQRAVAAARDSWVAQALAGPRVPAQWEQARAAKPDLEVLREAGFEILGRWREPATLEWSFESLLGYLYSTSVLSRSVLSDRAAEFEADLRRRLVEVGGEDTYVQETEFACDLARRPPPSGLG
jgi:SAM-dependent methyltransferase